MIPPDKKHLKALAGWTLTIGDGSDQQQLALREFRESCGNLAEVIDSVNDSVSHNPAPDPSMQVINAIDAEPESVYIPPEVVVALNMDIDSIGHVHQFDIRTQRCACGKTYRQVASERAVRELM